MHVEIPEIDFRLSTEDPARFTELVGTALTTRQILRYTNCRLGDDAVACVKQAVQRLFQCSCMAMAATNHPELIHERGVTFPGAEHMDGAEGPNSSFAFQYGMRPGRSVLNNDWPEGFPTDDQQTLVRQLEFGFGIFQATFEAAARFKGLDPSFLEGVFEQTESIGRVTCRAELSDAIVAAWKESHPISQGAHGDSSVLTQSDPNEIAGLEIETADSDSAGAKRVWIPVEAKPGTVTTWTGKMMMHLLGIPWLNHRVRVIDKKARTSAPRFYYLGEHTNVASFHQALGRNVPPEVMHYRLLGELKRWDLMTHHPQLRARFPQYNWSPRHAESD